MKLIMIVGLFCILIPTGLLGLVQLRYISNQTNYPYTLISSDGHKIFSIKPHAITQLAKQVKLSGQLSGEYTPWHVTSAETEHGITMQYGGKRYDICGVRARWYEKGPFYLSMVRHSDGRRFDECIVGPQVTNVGLELHDHEHSVVPKLVSAHDRTRVLQ